MILLAVISMVLSGCLRNSAHTEPTVDESAHSEYQGLAKQIEYPQEPLESANDLPPFDDILFATHSPLSLATPEVKEYLELSLQDAIQLAFANSKVLRDLGGTVLRVPDGSRTKSDPSIIESDPRFGIEGALSAFDAQFTSNFSFEKNNRALNNVFFGGGTRLLKQDFATWQTQIAKTAATGTQYSFKNYTQYDANNAPGNFVGSAFTTWYDAEARHPLLQRRQESRISFRARRTTPRKRRGREELPALPRQPPWPEDQECERTGRVQGSRWQAQRVAWRCAR